MSKNNLERNDDRIKSTFQKVTDGWGNLLTGMGIKGRDSAASNMIGSSDTLTESQNRNLYRTDFGAKIVNRPVDDMVRNWFDITNDTDGDINKFLLNDLCAQEFFKKGLSWGNVFGGSIIVMLIDDGAQGEDAIEQPLNETSIKEIKGLRVYDRHQINCNTTDFYTDANHPKFGTPQFYRITSLSSTQTTLFRVHESRVLRFDGPLTDEKIRITNRGWNDSIYQKGSKALGDLEGTYSAASSIINDFIQSVLQIDNLQMMISSGQEAVVKKRMSIMDLSRSVLGMFLIDSKETYSKTASSVGGLNELMQEFQQRVAGVYNIPMTFMGRSPGGLSATGASDIQLYYDEIRNQQRIQMLKQVQRLVNLTMLSKLGPTNGKIIEDWSISFNPLEEPTEKEIAETRKLNSETDMNYINSGVLDPNEVRKIHFAGSEYSNDILVEGDLDKPEPEIIEKPAPVKS